MTDAPGEGAHGAERAVDADGNGPQSAERAPDAAQPDAPSEATPSQSPVTDPPAIAADASEPPPATIEADSGDNAGEQIEWQPVVDGDKIEWQPVMASDAASASSTPEPPPGGSESWEAGADFPDPAPVTVDAAYEGVGEEAWPSGSEESWPAEEQAQADVPLEGEAQEEAAAGWEGEGAYASEPEFDYPEEPAAETEADWEAAAVPRRSPVGGNGAGRPRPGGAKPRSGPRPGPARRPSGGSPPARREPGGPSGGNPPGVKKQVIILSVLTALVLGIAAAAFFISRDATDKGEQAQNDSTPPTSTTVSTLPESALQTFTDEQTGFSLKYAKAWERLVPPVADIRLVVNAGGNDGFQVRVAPIQTPATTDNIGNFKAVTDAVVLGDQSARLLQEQLVTVNGLLTYYYLYSFQDPVTNTQGVHAHYFIFEGNRLFMLNFQTVPIEEFPKHAGLYDQIAESFVVQPRPNTTAAPEPTPTVAPTTTTVP